MTWQIFVEVVDAVDGLHVGKNDMVYIISVSVSG